MSTLYVTEPGTTITCHGDRLQVCHEGEVLRWVAITRLKQLVLAGNIGLTAGARSLVLRNGVDTIFLNTAGAYRGRLIGPNPAFAELRWRQYQQLHDPAFTLAIAREIVRGK
ncbi:hypothetical protein GX586_10265, partial [bacterium]|nr:hypothetical protein [bacterium]